MFNFINTELILEAAIDSARMVYNDVSNPQALAPENYDGDGESFAFDWSEKLRFSFEDGLPKTITEIEEIQETAKCFYLSAFWIKIREYQKQDLI